MNSLIKKLISLHITELFVRSTQQLKIIFKVVHSLFGA